MHCCRIVNETKNKNIKNSLLAMPVLRTCRQRCAMSDFKPRFESDTPHHQRRPPLRGRWHHQKDKNRSPSAKNQSSEIRLSENTNKKRPESRLFHLTLVLFSNCLNKQHLPKSNLWNIQKQFCWVLLRVASNRLILMDIENSKHF